VVVGVRDDHLGQPVRLLDLLVELRVHGARRDHRGAHDAELDRPLEQPRHPRLGDAQLLRDLRLPLDRLDTAALAEAQERQDAMAAQRLVQAALFGAMDT